MTEQQKEHFNDIAGDNPEEFIRKVKEMPSNKAVNYIQDRKAAFEVFNSYTHTAR